MQNRDETEPEARSVSATDAQNHFGQVLDRVASQGAVFIRKYDRPAAVLLSMDTYHELSGPENVDLVELTREFDEVLSRMQTDEAAAATEALFDMGTNELGRAAVRGARGESE